MILYYDEKDLILQTLAKGNILASRCSQKSVSKFMVELEMIVEVDKIKGSIRLGLDEIVEKYRNTHKSFFESLYPSIIRTRPNTFFDDYLKTPSSFFNSKP